MRRLLIAMAMLFSAPGTALACSCIMTPNDPAQLRQLAGEIAQNAVALVEVDVRSGYNARTRRGEAMRVRRTFAGRAPRDFRVARGGRAPSSASCDMEYARGSRALLVIYRADPRDVRGGREYRESGLCTSLLLQNAQFRQMLIEAMRRPPAGERASASPPASPCGTAA